MCAEYKKGCESLKKLMCGHAPAFRGNFGNYTLGLILLFKRNLKKSKNSKICVNRTEFWNICILSLIFWDIIIFQHPTFQVRIYDTWIKSVCQSFLMAFSFFFSSILFIPKRSPYLTFTWNGRSFFETLGIIKCQQVLVRPSFAL